MSNPHDSRDAMMSGVRTDGSKVRRPLSPHLQAYDMLQLNSVLSIANRATGAAWSLGLVFLVWWLLAAADGPSAFATVEAVLGSIPGLLVLFGMTLAVWYHTLSGVRHLAWDAGQGYALPTARTTGWIVVAATGVATVLTWLLVALAWA